MSPHKTTRLEFLSRSFVDALEASLWLLISDLVSIPAPHEVFRPHHFLRQDRQPCSGILFGSSNYATCMPNLAGFEDEKADMLLSRKIHVYIILVSSPRLKKSAAQPRLDIIHHVVVVELFSVVSSLSWQVDFIEYLAMTCSDIPLPCIAFSTTMI